MTSQAPTIWNNLLQKAIWGKDRFQHVVDSLKSLHALHQQTNQTLECCRDHNRRIKEWVDGIGFRPFHQMRSQQMEEQWKVVESGAKNTEQDLSEIQSKSRSLRSFLEQVERALQGKSLSISDQDHLSNELKEFSDALLTLDRHLQSVHEMQKSAEQLHLKTQEQQNAVQQDQNLLSELSLSIELVRDNL